MSHRQGIVYLNGEALSQTEPRETSEPYARQGPIQAFPRCSNTPEPGAPCLKTQRTETLPSGRSYQVLDVNTSVLDNTEAVIIPEDQFLFLGDNRDNAADSRLPYAAGGLGLIPREGLTGRVAWVLFSSSGTSLLHVWTWRADRLLKRVQ